MQSFWIFLDYFIFLSSNIQLNSNSYPFNFKICPASVNYDQKLLLSLIWIAVQAYPSANAPSSHTPFSSSTQRDPLRMLPVHLPTSLKPFSDFPFSV